MTLQFTSNRCLQSLPGDALVMFAWAKLGVKLLAAFPYDIAVSANACFDSFFSFCVVVVAGHWHFLVLGYF